jgi:uncharacterized membrane protein YdjX (TVP38/TMEM64 family)
MREPRSSWVSSPPCDQETHSRGDFRPPPRPQRPEAGQTKVYPTLREKLEKLADTHPQGIMILQLALVVAVIPVVRYAFRHGYISQADIQQVVSQAGLLAAPSFILILAAGMLIFAPPALLVGSGAIVFGSTQGAIYSLVGVVVGACTAFLLGRYVASDFARTRKLGRLKKINDWLEFNGVAFTFSSRLMFFANPTFNYAASLTTVKFKDYALGSFIGCLPGVFILSHLFHAVIHTRSLVDILRHPAFVAMWVMRFSGVALFNLLTRWYNRKSSPETDQA